MRRARRWSRAARARPLRAAAASHLGNLAHEDGRLDAALAAYRAALALDTAEMPRCITTSPDPDVLRRGGRGVDAFRLCLAEAPDYADARASLLSRSTFPIAPAPTTPRRALRMGRRIAIPLARACVFQFARAAAPPAHRLCVCRFLRACRPRISSIPSCRSTSARATTSAATPMRPYRGEPPALRAQLARYQRTRRRAGASLIAGDAIDILVDLSDTPAATAAGVRAQTCAAAADLSRLSEYHRHARHGIIA